MNDDTRRMAEWVAEHFGTEAVEISNRHPATAAAELRALVTRHDLPQPTDMDVTAVDWQAIADLYRQP